MYNVDICLAMCAHIVCIHDNINGSLFAGHACNDGFDWASFLLQIGNGTYPESASADLPPHSIKLPADMLLQTSTPSDFVTHCLGETISCHKTGHHMLAPKHEDVDLLNSLATDRMVEKEVISNAALLYYTYIIIVY